MEFKEKFKVFYPPITNHPDTNITWTGTIPRSKGVLIDGELIVRAGTILPNNDETAEFVVNDTYIVTNGDAIGSLIKMGRVLRQRLPIAPTTEAIESLASHGVFVEDADETSRPNFGKVADLTPIATPTLTNNAAALKFTWNSVTDAKAYQVFENGRVVAMIIAGQTLEYVYGSLPIERDYNVKAIGDNLTHGNSKMSATLTISGVTATGGEI